MTSRFWLHLRANSTGSYTWSRCGAYAEPKEVHHGSCEKWSACEWKLEMIYWMRWPGYQAFRKGSSSSSQAWLRVLCRRINWPWSSHPKSTSKGYQSFGQSPCLASVWLSFVDTTVGDDKHRGDWQDKTRLLLRLGEGTPVAQMWYFAYQQEKGEEAYVW